MASFSDIFKAVPKILRRRRYENGEGIPGSADPNDPTTPAALPEPVVRRRRVETVSPEMDADAVNRAAGIDPATGRLMRAPRRDEYGQNLEGAQGYSDDLAAYRPEDHNGRLKSIGLGLLRGFAGGGLGGLVAGGISHGVDPSLDEKYAKRVALSQAGGEIGQRYGMAKADSDLQNEDVERKLRIAQAIKAMRGPDPSYNITPTEDEIVAINTHDPSQIVKTGLRPPKRPESQVQYVERKLADGTVVKVPAGTALTAEATQGRFETEAEMRERERRERRQERQEDRAEKAGERDAADAEKGWQDARDAAKAWNAKHDELDEMVAEYNSLVQGPEENQKKYAAYIEQRRQEIETLRAQLKEEHQALSGQYGAHIKMNDKERFVPAPRPKRTRTSGGATPSRVDAVINRVRGRR